MTTKRVSGWASWPVCVWPVLVGLVVVAPAGALQDNDPAVRLLELSLKSGSPAARSCLQVLTRKLHAGELQRAQSQAWQDHLTDLLSDALARTDHELHDEACLLATGWGDPQAIPTVVKLARTTRLPASRRVLALESLRLGDAVRFRALATEILQAEILQANVQEQTSSPSPNTSTESTEQEMVDLLLPLFSRVEDAWVAQEVLKRYPQLAPATRPKAIELLTQRPAWSHSLLAAIGQQRIAAAEVNLNQVRKLLASRDEKLAAAAAKIWGTVRTNRNPQREQVIDRMKNLLAAGQGEARRGQAVFARVCGQCHKLHGMGQDVGPDLTSNGRNSFEQLLSNVFDPSLVIGPAYQAQTVITAEGRILTGLLVEDSDQRIVLKLQGGKLESIPRAQIDESRTSPLSLMPEGLEQQMTQQEILDLFAYLRR